MINKTFYFLFEYLLKHLSCLVLISIGCQCSTFFSSVALAGASVEASKLKRPNSVSLEISGLKTCANPFFAEGKETIFDIVSLCDSLGRLRRLEYRFASKEKIAQVWIYDENRKLRECSSYDIEGERKQWLIFEPEGKEQYIKWDGMRINVGTSVRTRILRNDDPSAIEKVMARFYYEVDTCPKNDCIKKSDRLVMMDQFDESGSEVVRRDFFKSDGTLQQQLFLHYQSPMRLTGELTSFSILNDKGRQIGNYIEDIGVDIPAIIKRTSPSPQEAARRIGIHENSSREPIVVIDTGFDIGHSDINYKLWSNPKDPVDGVDNDNNGWIDDLFGWYSDPSPMVTKESNQITERQSFLRDSSLKVPFSHGTHVASLALKNIDDYALVGFAGDFSKYLFLQQISEFLEKQKVRFVNMSFGFGDTQKPFSFQDGARDMLELMVRERTKTLFFVAAGNDSHDLDEEGYRDYPASFPYSNLLVVGALDQSEFNELNFSNAKRADFSNWGHKSVDFFAPGKDVLGAAPGGGSIRVSGTSMASPLAMNVALKVAKIASNLSILEVKELLMKTVYIPSFDHPMEALSGGALFPRRAYYAAQLAARGQSVESAALEAHRLVRSVSETKINSKSDLFPLIQFWRSRSL